MLAPPPATMDSGALSDEGEFCEFAVSESATGCRALDAGEEQRRGGDEPRPVAQRLSVEVRDVQDDHVGDLLARRRSGRILAVNASSYLEELDEGRTTAPPSSAAARAAPGARSAARAQVELGAAAAPTRPTGGTARAPGARWPRRGRLGGRRDDQEARRALRAAQDVPETLSVDRHVVGDGLGLQLRSSTAGGRSLPAPRGQGRLELDVDGGEGGEAGEPHNRGLERHEDLRLAASGAPGLGTSRRHQRPGADAPVLVYGAEHLVLQRDRGELVGDRDRLEDLAVPSDLGQRLLVAGRSDPVGVCQGEPHQVHLVAF
ncbi:unnamed protein product, partial [Wuchereria bancrofti]